VSSVQEAARYRAILATGTKEAAAADEYFLANEPGQASIVRTSVSPNIFTGGYRFNVIPSEANATLDVRMLPDENEEQFLQTLKKVINNPAIEVSWSNAVDRRPRAPSSGLDTDAFKAIEAA